MLHSLRIRKSLINVNNPQAAQAQFPQWKLGVKSLKSQWVGKITTQQKKKSKVNTVSGILLNILATIYRFESFT